MNRARALELLAQGKPVLAERFGVMDLALFGSTVRQTARSDSDLAIGEVQTAVRRRVLRSALRRGLLSADDAQVMAEWEHGGGFSVDAQVRIEAHEREGLEHLMRY